MKSVVRCFIAAEIAPSVRSEIDKTVRVLAERVPSIKWVRPDQFHLTLKFLGDVATVELHQVIRAVESACREIEPFDLFFEQLGAFPDTDRPHTLWVGLSEGLDETRTLAQSIETALVRLDFPKERRLFMPHLTIGRVRQGAPDPRLSQLAPLLAELRERSFGASEVDAVTIYSSELSRRGPKYDVLAEIDLKTV